ncbi:MAG: hypothetical protein ACI4HI_14795 [Lachnospiraceae bacterium]
MEILEFTQRLFKTLDSKEQKEVLKEAARKNFCVQGFKNSSMAPMNMVLKAMERSGKDKRPGSLVILESIVHQFMDEGNGEAAIAAAEWLCGEEETQSRAQKRLEKLEQAADEGKGEKTDENRQEQVEKKQETTTIINEDQNHWQEQETNFKNKIKKLQATIQKWKIQSENQEKQYLQLKKEKDRLQRKIEEQQQNMEVMLQQKDTLMQTIQRQKEEIQKLQKESELLAEYKRRVPKILCFSKTSFEETAYPFYNITWIEKWNEDMILTIDWKRYQDVWIISKDFSYYEIMEISKCAVGRVSKFLSMKRLKNKIEERTN